MPDLDTRPREVAFLVAPEGVEESELTVPWRAVQNSGARPVLVSTGPDDVATFNHLDRAGTLPVDEVVRGLDADGFAALVLPGGVANPDYLRTQPEAVAFVRSFFEHGIPVAVICHGPWTLVEAGVLNGRTITSWPSLRTDLINAGAHWVDEEVFVCTEGPNTLISSRKPDDLSAFCEALLKALDTRPAIVGS